MVLLEKGQVSCQVDLAMNLRPDTAACHGFKGIHSWQGKASVLSGLHHSLGQGVFAAPFNPGSLRQKFPFR